MALTIEQRGVLFGMCTAVVATAVALIGACLCWPVTESHASLSDRLVLFAISASALSIVVAASVARLANHRFFDQRDIGGSATPGQTDQAVLLQVLLQNTLEQSVLGFFAYVCWCLLAPANCLPAVPAAAALFFVGRLLFFARYKDGAASRSFGFAITFYPTVALTVGNVCFAVIRVTSIFHQA